MKQTLKIRLQFDKYSEVRKLSYYSVYDLTRQILLRDRMCPRILCHLLDTKRYAVLGFVNFKNKAFDLCALFMSFAGMVKFLCPAHIRDMNKTVDTRFDLDERAIIRKARNLSCNDCSRRIFLRSNRPRISLKLFDTKRYFLLILINVKNHNFDLFVKVKDVRRMCDTPGPAHLADMDKTFDTFLKANKRTVVHDIDNSTLNSRTGRITFFDALPRALNFLLKTERYFLVLLINADDHAFDFLIELNDLGWMRYPAPAKIRNMKKTVKTAKVNEYAKVCDILDDTLADLTDFDLCKDSLFAALTFFLDQFTT